MAEQREKIYREHFFSLAGAKLPELYILQVFVDFQVLRNYNSYLAMCHLLSHRLALWHSWWWANRVADLEFDNSQHMGFFPKLRIFGILFSNLGKFRPQFGTGRTQELQGRPGHPCIATCLFQVRVAVIFRDM